MISVIKFDGTSISGLTSNFGCSELWAKVSDSGKVLQELGFLGGRLVHRYPGSGEYGSYGILEGSFVSDLSESCPSDVFDDIWENVDLGEFV
jgi:hypothetical protein